MIKELEEKLDTIEILRLLCKAYKEEHDKCPCAFARQRIAWDWHKAQILKKTRQREVLELADQLIPDLNSILI